MYSADPLKQNQGKLVSIPLVLEVTFALEIMGVCAVYDYRKANSWRGAWKISFTTLSLFQGEWNTNKSRTYQKIAYWYNFGVCQNHLHGKNSVKWIVEKLSILDRIPYDNTW